MIVSHKKYTNLQDKTIAVIDLNIFDYSCNREKVFSYLESFKRVFANVLVVTTSEGRDLYQMNLTGLNYEVVTPYIKLRLTNRLRYLLLHVWVIYKTIAINSNKPINIVYSITAYPPNIIPALIFKIRLRAQKFITIFDNLVPPPWERSGSFLFNSIAYVSFKLTKKIIDHSNLVFCYMTTNTFSRVATSVKSSHKFVRFDQGLNKNLISMVSNETRTIDLIYVGRLTESKGVFDFIKALSCIENSLSVVIIGSSTTSDVDALKATISKLPINILIDFRGFVSTVEKFRLMKSSRFCVSPSRDESYPQVSLEALACGCELIAYDLPIYHDIPYSRFDLHLVEKGNIKQLTNMINSLLRAGSKNEIRDLNGIINSWEDNILVELDRMSDCLNQK